MLTHLLLLLLNGLPDGKLAGALADLGKVCARVAGGHAGQERKVNIPGHGGPAQGGPQDAEARGEVRQWDVDQLVQSTWPRKLPK